MFRMPPSRPARSEDDEITGAGRPIRHTRVTRTHREEARLRLNALPAAVHADPSRRVPIPCAPAASPRGPPSTRRP